ncbi:MAG: Tfp pilus assembly protein PilN [Oceanicoccus sp.]|jgi:Tfp pilus assembly protein PilN
MDNSYQAPQGRLLSTLVIFFFVIGVLYTLFLVFQQSNLTGDLTTMEEQTSELQTKIETLEREQIQTLFIAQELKDGVEASSITWSKVIRKFQDLTPVTVFFSSFSGGSEGDLSLSGLADNAGSVADMISVLSMSDDFLDAFVPSLTEGSTSDGQTVVSFNLSVNVSN